MTQTSGLAPARGWRPKDTLARRVKMVRDDLGESQRAFAVRVGMTFGELQSLEAGASVRNEVAKVKRIAAATGIDRDWLLFGGPLADPDTHPDPDSNGNTRWYLQVIPPAESPFTGLLTPSGQASQKRLRVA
jgi:transcriptional regulator with XRE-family HTH domain